MAVLTPSVPRLLLVTPPHPDHGNLETLLPAAKGLVEAVQSTLGDEARLRRMRLKKEEGSWVVQVDLGGTEAPDEQLRNARLRHAKEHLGEEAGVRVTYRYETVVR